jgi:hypothetical protein
VEYLGTKSKRMDDTRSPRPTFQAHQDENIFEKFWTHFRVLNGPFRVQRCHFEAHLPFEVEYLDTKINKVDDTRSPRPTFWARPDENIFGQFWTHLRVLNGPFRVQKWHFEAILPFEMEYLGTKSNKMDDTRSPRPTFQAHQDENIFGKFRTHFRVLNGPFRVQKCHFEAHLPFEVEYLDTKINKVDDTRSPRPTFWAHPDENIFGKFWTHLRVLNGPFRVQ